MTTAPVRIPAPAVASIRHDLELARDAILARQREQRPLVLADAHTLIRLATGATEGCIGIHWGRAPQAVRSEAGRSFRLGYVLCTTRRGAEQLCRALHQRGYAALHCSRIRHHQLLVGERLVSGYCVIVLLSPNPDTTAQGFWVAPPLAEQRGWQAAADARYAQLEAEDRADAEAACRVARERGDAEYWEDEGGREVDFLFVQADREAEFGPSWAVDNPLERELWGLEQEINVFWAQDPHMQRIWAAQRKWGYEPDVTVAKLNARIDREKEERAQAHRNRRKGAQPSTDEQLFAASKRERLAAMAQAVTAGAALASSDVAWELADDVLGE
jgi:hypothetical protein